VAETQDSGGESGQGRRRRGRRGGRKPREASGDTYAWSWPARLSGDDPYEWRGPVESAPVIEGEAVVTEAKVPAIPATAPTIQEVVAAPAPAATQAEEIWVELPEAAPAAKPRARRRRAARADEASAEAVAVEAPTIEAAIAEPAVEVPSEPAVAEPPAVVLAVDNPPPPLEPDPAEIVSPPVSPKRGWWRRSV